MTTPIIEKIRKLRALALSDNVNEAAAAAAAVERLIQEYQLGEVSFDVPEADSTVTSETVFECGPQIPRWQEILLSALRRAYSCSAFWNKHSGKSRYVAYGRKSDLETLSYQYAYFSSEILRLSGRECKGKGRRFATAFRIGAALDISEAILAMQNNARGSATTSALATVDERAKLARDTMYRENPNLRKRQGSNATVDGVGLAAGRQAGAGVNQRSQLGANGMRLLGS